MSLVKSAFIALALGFSAGAASANPCNIVAADVTGDGHFVDLNVTGCGYASLDMKGAYSFADIINKFGALVTGIYGNGHHYEVTNIGDNQVASFIEGRWQTTRLDIVGDGNNVVVRQNGRSSSVTAKVRGHGSTLRVDTH